MIQKPWKRALSLVLAFALVFAMPCVTSVYADNEVVYVERWWDSNNNVLDSHVEKVTSYTEITSSSSPTTWVDTAYDGWYVAKGNVTIGSEETPQRVTVNGDVNLILTDGCQLTVNGGIEVEEGNSLTIYGQKEGTGTLTATATGSDAGIGGNGGTNPTPGTPGASSGTITIHGGVVEATGSYTASAHLNGGAGIGGGGSHSYYSGSSGGGTFTMFGGEVKANGGDGGAGIGGGCNGSGGSVNIYGGKVTANGGSNGAGIGGGKYGDGGKITISGGEVEANGGENGAGIGGGKHGDGGKIVISGGKVTANGDGDGAGIGGGLGSTNNGTFSTTEVGTAVIFAAGSGSASAIADQDSNGTWSGIIFEKNGGDASYTGKVYGEQTLQNDLTLPKTTGEGEAIPTTLAIPAGASLMVPDGKTLTVNKDSALNVNEGGALNVENGGILDNKGTLANEGALNVNEGGTVTNSGTITSTGTVNGEIGGDGSFTQSVTGVTLDQSALSLTAGEMKALTATVQPDNATNKSVTWSSSDSRVARVLADSSDSTKATVTAVGVGTATITVTAADDGEKATCTVTVTKKPASSSGGSGSPLPVTDGSTPGTEPGGTFSQPEGCVSDTLGKVDVNGAYQFRFTSTNGTPPAVELDSPNFRAVLVSQEGNDYFYKVYAVGQPGQQCTVTVNGTTVAQLTASAGYGGVISDTTAPFSVAAGGSYQFRLTADTQPTLAAGSPSFTVESVGNEGCNWFFKVYAVGKPGDGCGFYVNGAPVPVAVAHIS